MQSNGHVVEQLGGLDSAFISCETPTTHLHVCALVVLDPSTMRHGYSYTRLRAMVLARLTSLSAVHQTLAWAPLHVSRPFWVDAPDRCLDSHVHRIVLEPPGDDLALGAVVGDIASKPLRRDRPLWEMWIVEGLHDGKVALVVKMHHAIIDGVSGTDVMMHLCDLEPMHELAVTSIDESTGVPGRFELLARGLASRLVEPLDVVSLVPTTLWRLTTTIWRLRSDLASTSMAAPFDAPRTAFNASISARRAAAFVSLPLVDIKRIKDAAGGTVNDVVTTIVGGALRHYLQKRDALPQRTLIAAEPVSVHDQTDEHAGTTRVSIMFSRLGTDEADPVARLRGVASANTLAKRIQRMVGADILMRWAEHLGPNVSALCVRLYVGLHTANHHRVVCNLILSNVAGPSVPLYVAGARVMGIYPLGPIMEGAGLNVTVVSHEGRVGFGITTCPDLMPDVWDLAAEIESSFADLLAAATTTYAPLASEASLRSGATRRGEAAASARVGSHNDSRRSPVGPVHEDP